MHFSLEKYALKMKELYKIDEQEQMMNETYACCVYMPS